MSGRQLLSHVELKLSNATRITSLQHLLPQDEDENENIESEDAEEANEDGDSVPAGEAAGTRQRKAPDGSNVDVSNKIGLGDNINWSQKL